MKTLRGKLLLSYILVILCCLLLVGSLSSFWLRRYEREVALSRARATAKTMERVLVGAPSRAFRDSQSLYRYLEGYVPPAQGRLLILNASGTILAGDEVDAWGHPSLPLPSRLPETPSDLTGLPWRAPNGRHFFVFTVPVSPAIAGEGSVGDAHYATLVVAARDIYPRVREWLLPLLGIGLLVLILSALISYVVSRSITHPVEAMTLAAEQIARGNLNQQIEVQTKDEVGRLAAAFNVMTREMARIQRTQQDFMINVSHDLQTPLTSIRGFAQAIVEGAVRDVAGITKAGRIIYEEANRMKRLVDALLNLVRLEAGQLELVQLPVNLVQLLRSCVQRFQATADAAGIALRLDLPPGLPQVQGDSERLGQSFANLLDNALKFTPPDGRVVISGYVLGSQRLDTESHRLGKAGKRAIRQAPFLSNGRWVVITVADTGIGMTDEETTRVFERFYRADQSRAGREGIGLGLSIAQEIVEAHGGHITVSSRPGQGSQFHVALPIRARNDTEKTER